MTQSNSDPKLPALRLIAFSAITVPLAAALQPLLVFIPAFYAKDLGLSLASIGLLMLFGRLWDAVNDPVIAILSDATRSRFGRRKPWIAAGILLFGLATIPLFFPPSGTSLWVLGLALFVFYLGWTMIQIPFSAWSGELSAQYHQRTRIATYQQVISVAAMLVLLVAPTWVDQIDPGNDRLKIAVMGTMVLVTLIPCSLLTLWAVKEPPLPRPSANFEASSLGGRVKGLGRELVQGMGLIFKDPLMLRVLASDFAVVLAQSIRSSLIVFFVISYMGLPQWASAIFLFQFVFGVFAGPIWLQIGYRFGKHRTAILGELVQVAINLGLLLVAPGNLALLLALTFAQGLAQGSGNLMLRSIVADVADKNRLASGVDRTALHFSVFSLSSKLAGAVAVGIALPLVGIFGFSPKGESSPEALQALHIIFALGPALAHLVSAWMLKGFNLDEEAHTTIRQKLAERDALSTAAE